MVESVIKYIEEPKFFQDFCFGGLRNCELEQRWSRKTLPVWHCVWEVWIRVLLLDFKSDVWLTVHRNSVWKRNQLDVTMCYHLFLLYKFLNMFRATMCPSSGADDCVVLSPRQNTNTRTPQWTHYLLTGSDSLPAATAQYQHVAITLRSHQLLKMSTWLPETCSATCKGEIKDNTKWHLVGFFSILLDFS